ncbi:hypothetical protein MGYG_02460 [Nannizzia gypsea CBS 118893]|uniref:Uncharacterized protein n=1 Tax=Arthroderma gypseum (strain ATCC MYA-4604 / CBS 118893) TaxID=535722 RepID=E4UMN2_ARTGP|nr:hypothetical protein MGYG_02460 [Nannizzia gypsea CBS 118893]EFQ99449.1 hypothetical protein MGYG_02460 [Nannizzia gypsea CBS 118893]
MKCFFIWLSVIGALLPQATAYAQRGALERLVYYYSYLADELVNAEEARTVAVGCSGSLPGKRCNLDEFLEYIWKPLPTESATTAPKVDIVENLGKPKFEDVAVSRLYTLIYTWKPKDSTDKRHVTGNTDNLKLLPGSTDYYDCLSKITGPIGALDMAKATFPDGDKKDLADKIVSKGKASAQLVYDFRLKDIEKHRKNFLKMQLMDGEVIYKQGRNVEGLLPGWKTLDAIATANALGPRGADRLDAAITAHKSRPNAMMHYTALAAADSAQELSGCPVGTT